MKKLVINTEREGYTTKQIWKTIDDKEEEC